MGRSRLLLAGLLLALAVLYAVWFFGDRHYIAVLLVFCLPPVLLTTGVMARRRRAALWAGVIAVFWFAHAVMAAWSRPAEGAYAWTAILLSVGIVLATCWPALGKRFGKRP